MEELTQRVKGITLSQAGTSEGTAPSGGDDNSNIAGGSENDVIIKYQITHDYTQLPKDAEDSFNIFYANMKSIKKVGKINELKCIIKMIPKTVHLILISESWIKADEAILSTSDLFQLENYKLEYNGRNDRSGGGVAAYIRDNFKYSIEATYTESNNYLWVSLNKIKIGVIYRPPGSAGENTFLTECDLQLQNQEGNNVYGFGDFNINVVEANKSSRSYENILRENGFVVLNNKSDDYFTRKEIKMENISKELKNEKTSGSGPVASGSGPVASGSGPVASGSEPVASGSEPVASGSGPVASGRGSVASRSEPVASGSGSVASGSGPVASGSEPEVKYKVGKKSVIDHVFTNVKGGTHHLALIDSSLSDHRQLYFEIRTPGVLPDFISSPNWRKSLGEAKNSNTKLSSTEDEMIDMINKIDNNNSLKQDKWITPKIMKGIELKNRLHSNFQNDPNEKNKKLSENAKNKVHTKIEVSNSAQRILSLVSGGSNKIPTKLVINSENVTDNIEICEQFTRYFSETGLNQNNLPELPDQPNMPSDIATCSSQINELNQLSKMSTCTPKEISEIITSLDLYSRAGIDGIHVKSLKRRKGKKKKCNDLSQCINYYFDGGLFPDCLKVLKVIPVYKSGLNYKLESYTFELVLPVFSKIIEKLLWKRINDFLPTVHYMPAENQYGFREKPNTVLPTIELVSKINESIDEKKIVLGVFIDLREASNKLNHSLLLNKLKSLGITGAALKILESYFDNRKFVVKISTWESNPQDVPQGVPQGSLLRDFLFLIYMNKILTLDLKGDITLSTGNITLFYYEERLEDLFKKAQEDLKSLNTWFEANYFVMNPKDICYMIFTNRQIEKGLKKEKLVFRDEEIARADQAAYFGLTLDRKLTWKLHIDQLKTKLEEFIDNIKLDGRCPQKLLLYYVRVRPYMEYLIEAWGSATKSNLKALRDQHANRIKKLNANRIKKGNETRKVLNINQNFLYATCILVYNIFKNRNGIKYKTQLSFLTTEEITGRATRGGQKLYLPKARTKAYGMRSFSYAGANMYNDLPGTVRNAATPREFKEQLRSHLRRNLEDETVTSDLSAAAAAGPAQAQPRSDGSKTKSNEDKSKTKSDEDKSKSDKDKKSIVYICTKCSDSQVYTSSQRKKHRKSAHPKKNFKKVFRRLVFDEPKKHEQGPSGSLPPSPR